MEGSSVYGTAHYCPWDMPGTKIDFIETQYSTGTNSQRQRNRWWLALALFISTNWDILARYLLMTWCIFSTRISAVSGIRGTIFSCLEYDTKYQNTSSHYSDVMMSAIASQITSLRIVYSTVYSGADQRKHQSSASLAFVSGIHRWPANSPHKRPLTRKMFPFDDVIM